MRKYTMPRLLCLLATAFMLLSPSSMALPIYSLPPPPDMTAIYVHTRITVIVTDGTSATVMYLDSFESFPSRPIPTNQTPRKAPGIPINYERDIPPVITLPSRTYSF